MRLAAVMEAADRTTKTTTDADAALARLLAEAPGAVRLVGAGLSNNPTLTKQHSRRLSKGGSKFFTSTHKGVLHPAIDGKGLSAADLPALKGRKEMHMCAPPDTTFASEEFAFVDRSASADKFGSTGKSREGTIVRRAFRALNNAMSATRRVSTHAY